MLFRTSLATAFLWLFVLVETRAQTGIVFSMTNTWRYEQTTNFDGVAWFSPGFNDSTWPSGRALLYVENNTLVSPRNTLLTLGRNTYYFRSRFQFTNSVAGIGLVFSNRVDDGAVFYLNGTEIQRLRMPAAPQPITYATGATGGQPPTDDAISNEVFMISGDVLTNLVVGTNTLAVEVHQIGSSSDIVFGAALSFIHSTGSFTFTQEPVGTNILDGRPLKLTVATSITPPPALQWFKDGQLLLGATLSTVTFPGISIHDSGTYWVVASNSTMMLTTRQATVVVEPDTVAPVLLEAIAQKNLTNIVIEISEPVGPTATNLANYQLFEAGGSGAAPQVIAASVSNATTIHLTTTPRTDRVNYELQLTGIIDLSSLSNAVSSSPFPLKYVFEIIRLDTNTLWRFDQSGMGVPAGWQGRMFDDSDWAEGRSLFYERFGGPFPFGPIGTRLQTTNLLGTGPVITYYFRTTAELPGFSSNAISLRHIIDDGAALYMNGEEFYTVRVTPPLNNLSLAAPNGGTPFFEPPTNQPALLVPHLARPGRNFIAAEVHQSGTNWGDAAFALSIETLIDEFAPELMLDVSPLATNGSVLPMAGNIAISKPLSTNLVIGLTSAPPNIVSMPATVAIAAGETNVTFDLAALETAEPTGPRRVEIHAFTPSFVPADHLVTVVDQVPLGIVVTLPAILTEGSVSPTGQITFAAPLATDITVQLTTSDRNTLYVPPAVTMPAGQTSVVFSTILASNIVLEGTRFVIVGAHVAGWNEGTAIVQVLDVPDSYRALPLSTRDIAYDPVTARIYASVPGSSASNAHRIIAIDPLTGAVEPGLAVGGEPGKLLVPPGGGLLYSAVETNRVLRRVDLQSGAVDLSFALETNASNLTVADYELLPGSPGAMAVLRLQNGFNADVAIYDEGIRRSNVGSGGGDAYQETIEVSEDGSSVYFQSFGFQGLRRFIVNPQGLTPAYTNTTITPPPYSRDWKAAGERFFSNDGVVIDPVTPQVISTIPNVPANSPLTYDSAINRVFYLLISGGTAILRAYEADSLIPAGEFSLTGVSGTPSSLIRWGPNGLAFRTDANQLFLINTSLIPTNPPADIATSLTVSPAPYLLDSNITETIVITNHGPNAAEVVFWTNTLPAGSIVISAESSGGTFAVVSNVVRGTISGMNTQMAVVVSIVFQPTIAGVVAIAATVGSSARETNLSNNSMLLPLWVRNSDRLANAILNLAVKDIARDPLRSRLYFSVGSSASVFPNSILIMNWETETVTSLAMNGDPGRLAVSSDGQFLYVALDSGVAVRRLALPAMTVDLSFSFPDARPVTDMAVCPTNSDLLAVWRQFDNSYSAYENGALLPIASATCFDTVGFFGDKVVNGIYYDNNGMIFDVATRQFHGSLPIPFNSLIEPDLVANRIYALTVPNGVPGWAIRAFDADQLIEVDYYFATLDGPSNFLRWGTDGFVFRTASQVYLLRSSLVPTNAPTDVALRTTVSAIRAATGSFVTYQLGVTNLGTNTAFGPVLTQAFSLTVTGVVLMADVGSVTNVGNFITWQLPPLPPGAGALLTVSLQAAQTGTLVARSAIRHSANDPRVNNNFALNVTRIGPPSTNEIREIALRTRQLVFDPLRQRIYASVIAREPFIGNSVVAIDPVTAQIEPLFFAGSEPNQLALSDDGQFLYVSLDGRRRVRRVNLTTASPLLEFPADEAETFTVVEMKVQPGHPGSLAVSRGNDVAMFDDGIMRPTVAGSTLSVEFSADGQRLYGSSTSGGSGFLRLSVSPTGVRIIDISSALYYPNTHDYEFQLDNGLLYSGLGRVFDPNIPALMASFVAHGTVAPDAGIGRVFQVFNDPAPELRVYTIEPYQLAGTMALPSVPNARHLVRCGGDRLAFRTETAGQVFLLKTSLADVPAVPSANLVVSQTAVGLTQPDRISVTINVDNQGPGLAENIRLLGLVPRPVTNITVQPSQGACGITNGIVTCSLNSLLAGGRATVQLTATITNTAMFSNFVSVTSRSLDMEQTNNTSSLFVQGYFHQPANTLRRFPVIARDLAFDPVRRRLFASLQETPNQNRLAWFNPETGALNGTVPLAMPPDRIVASDDGNHLYVTGLSTSLIQRVHLPSLTIDLGFNLPTESLPLALRVLPTQSTNCIIAYSHANFPAVGLFKDGVLRPTTVGGSFRQLAITPDGSTLYGYAPGGTGGNSPDLFRLRVDDDGIVQLAAGPSDFPSFFSHDMEFSSGRLYMGQGNVVNASNWAAESSFPALNFEQRVEVDEPAARVILLAPSTLGIYDQFSRQELTRFNIAGVLGGLVALTRCGADRLAFLSANELFIVRNNALVAADLTLSAFGFPITATAGSNFTITVAVLNRGPAAASGVIVTNLLPGQSQLVSAFASQGSIVNSGNSVVLNLTSLNSGSAATLAIRLNPTNRQDVVLSNVATVVATTGDPLPADNKITTLVLGFADNDQDRMADSWEMAFFYGTNALNGGAMSDYDQDGVSNLHEYQQGTDPAGPNSLRVRPVALSATEAILYFHGQIGVQYQVEGSPTVHGPWTGIGPMLTGHGFGITTTNILFPFPSRFYRIRQNP